MDYYAEKYFIGLTECMILFHVSRLQDGILDAQGEGTSMT
ncbi:hypothetical protein SDC9_167058 [bioreactor metagenome]|uniref:Uncharacterized protein n=1 Tax=bioreactor metagenome TaxID=1076179 RepID=A0A645G0M3_9ZZZZ